MWSGLEPGATGLKEELTPLGSEPKNFELELV